MNRERLQKLFATLIMYRHNIHILHWKVVGCDFDCVHKLLDDYVSQFNTFIDEVAEIMLSENINPLSLQETINILEGDEENHFLLLDAKEDYDGEQVLNSLDKMFTDLTKLYDDASDDCPDECESKFDEHKYWIRIEALYKNKRRMNKK